MPTVPAVKRGPFGTCPAPKILTATPCGHFLEDGQQVCRQHEATDPTRRCEGETGPRAGPRRRCSAWPLVTTAFCRAHDPVAKAERHAEHAERDSLTHQLRRLRQLVSPAVAVKALDLLVLRQRVTVQDVAAALAEYRVSL